MQGYVDELKLRAERPGDAVLIRLIGMQLVVEKASVHYWYETTLRGTPSSTIGSSYYARCLDVELDAARKEYGPAPGESGILRLQWHAVELTIAEMALLHCTTHSGTNDWPRQRYMAAAVDAAKTWLNVFFEFTPEEYTRFPMGLHSPVARCMMLLLRHSTSTDVVSDEAEKSAEKSQMIQIIDRLIGGLDVAIASLGIVAGNDIYSRHRSFWINTRNYWLPRLSASTPSESMTDMQLMGSFITNDFPLGELFGIDFPEGWAV
ncbi:hypothetical protein ANO11243_080760 [Dothideomycetidae sp. 11243]|nr:hypothetical protein ANO11243_080760 [fungal sp. No.11243]